MSNSSIFSTLILFDTMFIGLLILFGQSTSLFNLSGVINDLNQGFPSFTDALNKLGFKGFSNCGFLDWGCNASNIAQATVWGAAFIGYGGLLFFSILQKMYDIVQIIATPVSTLNSGFGVPFLGFIFLGFQVLIIAYAITIIRGNPTGL